VKSFREGEWENSALLLALETSSSFSDKPSKSFAEKSTQKSLNWMAFSDSKTRSLHTSSGDMPLPVKPVANKIPQEVVLAQTDLTSKPVLKKKSKYLKSRKWRLKKARLSRKNRAKRYARVKRRNKGAYRVARKVKKTTVKKSVSSRVRRKKFGFSFAGSGVRLSGL
jgi:hypothetical protein